MWELSRGKQWDAEGSGEWIAVRQWELVGRFCLFSFQGFQRLVAPLGREKRNFSHRCLYSVYATILCGLTSCFKVFGNVCFV